VVVEKHAMPGQSLPFHPVNSGGVLLPDKIILLKRALVQGPPMFTFISLGELIYYSRDSLFLRVFLSSQERTTMTTIEEKREGKRNERGRET
jgi:hypothetical protein